ncbi:flagellar hook-length control protein FliK [Colwellia sp. D2M02]|uniref:flagellar hook-length control protein FliK n=1 Tax=Colwellia sp. D2M02 TaxID=2841562 RepID=UPI001C08D6C7|nr:flagellar hook-length control protein FliK [Colwellia sp. D2M02]MBU2892925.1 flagellar hook-length control protein FliK [Colwellia sp. D2M02]
MQQVNTLAIMSPQDTESTHKNSSVVKNSNDSDFSTFVDKHLDKKSVEGKEKSEKTGKSDDERSSGKVDNGHAIAADGNAEKAVNNEVTQGSVSEDDDIESLPETDTAGEGQVGKTQKNDPLAQSEQFFSLLYQSDNALTNNQVKTKVTTNADVNITTPSTASTDEAVGADKDQIVNYQASTEHKLKAFINQNTDVQSIANNSSTSTANLMSYQRAVSVNKLAGENDKALPLSDNISELLEEHEQDVAFNANRFVTGKAQPEDTKPTLGSQVPVTPTNTAKDAPLITSPANEPVSKNIETMQLSSKEVTSDSELALKSQQTSSLITENTSKILNGKAVGTQFEESTQNKELVSSKVAEAIKQELNGQSQNQVEPKSQQTKQSTINSNLAETLKTQNQIAAQEGEENSAADDLNVEKQAVEAELMLTGKGSEPVVAKSEGSQVANPQVRSINDSASHVTQIRHESQAYNAHESAIKMDQSVTSEVVQTQKHNVQLQQETIALFRKDFAEAVKDKVMLVISQKLQQFDITLDPPEFGNMQVRVNLQGEQASVNFVVQNQQAKDALEQNMHKLKDMLAEQGVDVGGADVRQQNKNQADSDDNASQGALHSNSTGKEQEDHSEHILSAALVNSSASGVDYYV